MKEIQGFKDLMVWQKSMALSKLVYRFTKYFPKEEIYGMTNQIRRASVSIPANIAEGSGRRTTSQFLYFLGVAKGSARELETEIILAGEMEFLQKDNCDLLCEKAMEVQKMISGLINSLEQKLLPDERKLDGDRVLPTPTHTNNLTSTYAGCGDASVTCSIQPKVSSEWP